MTDRDREAIEYYLPNEPDPSLEENEYFFLQYTTGGARVIRVFVLDILPHHEGTEYGIYQMKGTRLCWVDAGYGTRNRGVRFHDLYDNKQDCKDQTHMCCDWWDELRKKQREEATT